MGATVTSSRTVFDGLTERFREILPDFGQKVAVDSTTVQSHSNPNRKSKRTGRCSDPEASWTGRTVTRGKTKDTDWYWGYKYHLMVDAKYGLPITGLTTTASQSDTKELPGLLDKARTTREWFGPSYVMADKGYSSRENHRETQARGATLISPTRRLAYGKLYEGIYTAKGVPTCLGMVKMEYVRSDPQKGHLYRCRREGCHLKDRKGVRYCDDEYWEGRRDDPLLFGPLRQKSPAWKALYQLRQMVEQVFKSLKESLRLERHHTRGLRNVSLHAAMSALAYSATALQKILAGEDDVRWMVRRVA